MDTRQETGGGSDRDVFPLLRRHRGDPLARSRRSTAARGSSASRSRTGWRCRSRWPCSAASAGRIVNPAVTIGFLVDRAGSRCRWPCSTSSASSSGATVAACACKAIFPRDGRRRGEARHSAARRDWVTLQRAAADGVHPHVSVDDGGLRRGGRRARQGREDRRLRDRAHRGVRHSGRPARSPARR